MHHVATIQRPAWASPHHNNTVCYRLGEARGPDYRVTIHGLTPHFEALSCIR